MPIFQLAVPACPFHIYREIYIRVNDRQKPGVHGPRIFFLAQLISSGIYFCDFKAVVALVTAAMQSALGAKNILCAENETVK